jgi:beta-galactosidase/beta-glucuronidase
MTGPIRDITVAPVRLTPAEAVLAIELQCAALQPTTEIRGRLMGPNCLYSTTIEVAHPLHMTDRERGHPPKVRGRIVIPEPAWWDCESPFLYHGPIELWEHERKIGEVRLRIGLRHAEWKGEQLHWNGKPIELRTQSLTDVDDATLQSLRQRGFNGVSVPAAVARSVWPVADRLGLLVTADGAVESKGLQHPSAIPAQPH